MDNACSTLPEKMDTHTDVPPLRWLLVDDSTKSIYCAVSKASSTTWKYFLIKKKNPNFKTRDTRAIEVHIAKILQRNGLRFITDYSEEEQEKRLRSYYKYLFVRHPFSRLISTYRDKFLQADEPYYVEQVAREIRRSVRGVEEENSTRGVEFHEFVQHMISGDPLAYDRHWMSVYLLCQPCNIMYDYVAKVETFTEDVSNILSHLNIPPGDFPFLNSHGISQAADREVVAKNLATLKQEHHQKLFDINRVDFDLFDYSHSVL